MKGVLKKMVDIDSWCVTYYNKIHQLEPLQAMKINKYTLYNEGDVVDFEMCEKDWGGSKDIFSKIKNFKDKN